MSKFRKLCAVLLSVIMLISSFSTTILSVAAEDTSAENTEAVSITGSALDFLYNQAIELDAAYAESNGVTSPTKARVDVSQTGPWFISTSRSESNHTWANAYYLWYLNSSEIRYGSNWTYWAPSVGIFGSGESRTLRAWLRNLSSEKSNVYNDYVKLYYVAETSGVYKIAPDEFLVNFSDAEGCEAYITIKVNGAEIFKSRALQRKNRIEPFEGAEVTLAEGDKIEWIFDYVVTDENGVYNGNMEFNFDPQLEFVEEQELPELEGTGSVADIVYEAVNALPATGNQVSVVGEQTAIWKAQSYANGNWSDLTHYCTYTKKENDGWMDWGYDNGSCSQTDAVTVVYNNATIANGTMLRAQIPMKYTNTRRPVRIAYAAEEDGIYTLTDNYNKFTVYQGDLKLYNIYPSVTVNGEEIWKSSTPLVKKGDTAAFEGVTATLKKGDVLAIEFHFELMEGATAGAESDRFRVNFDPMLSFIPDDEPVINGEGGIAEILYDALDLLDASGSNKSALVTQTAIWRAQMYSSKTWKDLTHYCNHSKVYTNWLDWGYNESSHSQTDRFSIWYYNNNTAKGLALKAMIPMWRSNMKPMRLSYIAEADGRYTLTDERGQFEVISEEALTEHTVYVRVTVNGAEIWKSNALVSPGDVAKFDGVTVDLKEGDTLALEINYERNADSTKDYNSKSFIMALDPILSYEQISEVEITGYTPIQTERYYAENVSAPLAFSAWINTNDVLAGNILTSDNLKLSLNNSGYPVISYGDKEIPLAFDIRSENWVHIALTYSAENEAWTLYHNGLAVAVASDSDYAATDISKLYIGASEDEYNHSHFKGSIAELALFGTELSAENVTEIYNAGVKAENTALYLELSDVTAETALAKETVSAPSQDRSENGLIFLNQNYRLDLYETFEVPVSTFEAWVRLENLFNPNASAGYITSSAQVNSKTNVGSSPCAMIEITTNGRPKLTFKDSSGQTDIIFNADIRNDDWVHLAITADYDAGYFYCYLGGELVDKQPTNGKQIPATTRPYVVSGNYYDQETPFYFQGDLAGITMFSDARTEEEIYNDIYGVDLEDADLLGSWNLEGTTDILNRNGDGNDLHPFWDINADETADDSFGNYSTFVFIPDTQNNVGGTADISKWIVDNKDKENIIGVIGLGDITNNNYESQWESAKAGYEPLKGVVPYVFVSGNHDIATGRNVTNFNKYFPYADWEPYMDGFFEEGKIDNMYTITEDANGNKYMLLALEFMPRDAVLDWANEVVEANPDCKVIVSTHGYQDYNYTSKQNYYITGGYDSLLGTDKNAGDQVWEKFASKHDNIISVVCGHVYHEDVHATTNTGDNGNTVHEIIANAQTTDVLMKASSTIMIMRVSEDGTKANINYLATEHGKYQKDLNQFTIDWIEGGYAEPVAEVNGVKYISLADAVAAANAGDTVTLLCDAQGEGMIINKDITIDFAGFTYTFTTPAVGSNGTVSNGLQLLKGNDITLKNGTLTVSEEYADQYYILVQNYSNLTVIDMTLDGTYLDKYSLTDGDSYTLSNNCGAVEVSGNTNIIANNDGDLAFAFDVCKFKTYVAPNVVVNTTGTISGKIEVTADIEDNLNINAGKFNADISKFIAEGSGMNIIDGIYTVADDEVIADIDKDGFITATDITVIRKQLIGTSEDTNVYDINGDGIFSIKDLVRIKKLLVELA